MSKLDDLVEKYVASSKEHRLGLSEDLIRKVAKGLGPSIYNADASTVSGSDDEELKRVKENYLIKKLGLSDSNELDEAVQEAVNKLGKSNRHKYRALVYAILCKKFGKEDVYN